MGYLLAKAVLSGVLVVAISELAKRSPALGALVASLPLVSLLAMVWLWRDTGDAGRVAAHAEATFWLVLPTLPMFLLLPWLLRQGYGFWPVLAAGSALTAALYVAVAALLRRFGIAI